MYNGRENKGKQGKISDNVMEREPQGLQSTGQGCAARLAEDAAGKQQGLCPSVRLGQGINPTHCHSDDRQCEHSHKLPL